MSKVFKYFYLVTSSKFQTISLQEQPKIAETLSAKLKNADKATQRVLVENQSKAGRYVMIDVIEKTYYQLIMYNNEN